MTGYLIGPCGVAPAAAAPSSGPTVNLATAFQGHPSTATPALAPFSYSAGDVIVMDIQYNFTGPLPNAPTSSAGLSFTQRASASGPGFERWIALAASSQVGDVISLNPGAAGGGSSDANVFSVSGCNGSSFPTSAFDGASVTAGSDPISITTTGTNRLVIAGFRCGSAVPTHGAESTTIIAGTFMISEQQPAPTATLYTSTMTTGAGGSNGAIIDAFKS